MDQYQFQEWLSDLDRLRDSKRVVQRDKCDLCRTASATGQQSGSAAFTSAQRCPPRALRGDNAWRPKPNYPKFSNWSLLSARSILAGVFKLCRLV